MTKIRVACLCLILKTGRIQQAAICKQFIFLDWTLAQEKRRFILSNGKVIN
jgi:hypothetical protein